MSGNTLGNLFAVTNFGESHGPAIGCVIDGCPPGMALSEADIQPELDRRRPGTSKFVTQRNEPDQVEILSGVYQGLTTGTPICLLIRNQDQRSKDYGDVAQTFRPGHADYTYHRKYGLRDPRGGGRSSARLTAPTVAAGAVARKWLHQQYGTTFRGCMTQVGELPIGFEDWAHVAHNPFFAPVADTSAIEDYMNALRKSGDSCGARLRVTAQRVPVGLGEPLYDRLDADIAKAMMGLNAVKGVEIGDGFASVARKGSTHGDSLLPGGRFASNHDGGVLGGISNGQDLEVAVAIKPTSSILVPRTSVNLADEPVEVITKGRHDPCVGIRATPILEALLALVVMEHALRQRAQCGGVAQAPHTDV
ncbi:chorismate synthase [Ottowia sp.]|uniref:chorismate synthase n=2 Tax=Ottowia sp. TaxID=1898956 RepID=UPI002C58FC74|nr:chorismate synthase [Ottowia sp.]HOB67410.1 chorismate synthase [Ottowia sp.]HQD49248.1 chorismate synthase [Ottowia sp.]